MSESPSSPAACPWLARIPAVLSAAGDEALAAAEIETLRRFNDEYRLVRPPDPEILAGPALSKYIRWQLPVAHMWPCVPAKTEGFVEKAATALAKRFAAAHPRTVLVGSLDGGAAGSPARSLASNVRGRALQLFDRTDAVRDVETLDPQQAMLYAMVGRAGLFAGIASPAQTKGFHPGGEKFVRTGPISRAGGKIAGALHHLLLHRPLPAAGARWLELGASPGGMTAELLDRSYQVTAIDRAPLDERLRGREGLSGIQADALHFRPPERSRFDAILCDLNGDPHDAMRAVLGQVPHLVAGGIVIFTLKLAGAEHQPEIDRLTGGVMKPAADAGLVLLDIAHLPANRHEFTCFLAKPA